MNLKCFVHCYLGMYYFKLFKVLIDLLGSGSGTGSGSGFPGPLRLLPSILPLSAGKYI